MSTLQIIPTRKVVSNFLPLLQLIADFMFSVISDYWDNLVKAKAEFDNEPSKRIIPMLNYWLSDTVSNTKMFKI